MRDEYTVLLEKSLSEANEMIGAITHCLEKILDGDKRYENIARTAINDVRAKRGKYSETNSK